jgi:RHS repeat-associated protein
MSRRLITTRRLGVRLLAMLLASSAFVQQALSAPGEIFESVAPVIGAEAPKAKDVQDGDVSVATQTGALQYSYPLRVPAGRGGAAPSLSLSYSSQAAVYGGIAAGWSLSIPSIQEDTSQGRLATHSGYYEPLQTDSKSDDRFTSSLAGGRPLVKVTEPIATDVYGAYRAQNDTTFARYERLKPGGAAKWRVRTTDGTTLFFGEASRTIGCTNIGEGNAPLTSTVDAHGNSVFYEWGPGAVANSAVECRIDQITWGMNANDGINTPFASIVFKYGAGLQCGVAEGGYIGAQFDFRRGVKVLSGASPLTAIQIKAFPLTGSGVTHTRTISLAYEPTSCTSPNGPVRLLSWIQERGARSDATLQGVTLPPIKFTYGSPTISFSATSGTALPPWVNDLTGQRANLGWGIRAPISAPDKWPTVEALMVDIDGDGLIDRMTNSSGTGGECRATWLKNNGPQGTSTLPSFGTGGDITLPRLRWRGDKTLIPNGGAAGPGPSFSEGCALNAQTTAYRNMIATKTPNCHDGDVTTDLPKPCQFSTTTIPNLTGEKFCYGPGADEFGLQCPGPMVGGDFRTSLAYRWLDADGDGLTDLVTAVHGNIAAYDITEGNDPNQTRDPAPFGPWPACPSNFDRCKVLQQACFQNADTPAQANACIANAPSRACGKLPVTIFQAPGSPHHPTPPNEPYERCEGLYPWMIYKNLGRGTFATTATIKYSPVPLESDNGDSATSGPSITSTGHGIFDFDGDGRLDAVKLDEQGNTWQVWRGDGTGGFDGRVHVIQNMTTWSSISANGPPWQYGQYLSTSMGTFDLNGDGLPDRWVRNPNGTGDIAWHNGTEFETVGGAGTFSLPMAGLTGAYALKPGNDTNFLATLPLPPPSQRIETGNTYAWNRLADVDHDGRVDIVSIAPPPAFTPINVYYNSGGGFLTNPSAWTSHKRGLLRNAEVGVEDGVSWWQLRSDLIDLDGDGISESIAFAGTNMDRFEHVTNGAPPRVMTSIDNGRGLISTVRYASMHDTTTVIQHPNELWFDGRPKASPANQWVVKSLATNDQVHNTLSDASQFYINPRHGADDEGRFAFRGFEEVWTNSASLSQSVERFDYQTDWSGRLVESRVHPLQATYVEPPPPPPEVRTIDRTTWKARTLFGGAITTYHATQRDHYTCANGQTTATCTASTAPGFTRSEITQTAFNSATGIPMLWQDTESTLQAGVSLANGDRQTLQTFSLKSETELYRFRPLATRREHLVAGSWVLFAMSAKTWDSDLKFNVTDETWFNTDDTKRAITRYVYDPANGNLVERYKPVQNELATPKKTTYTYDDRKLYVASETNELGHVETFTYDYGTGAKLTSVGPNAATCGSTCPAGSPPGSVCLAKEQNETKVDGLGRPIEQWATVSEDGCYFYYHQLSTTAYADALTAPPSVTERTRIDAATSVWKQSRTDLDGHGRPIRETVFAQGTAPADQVSTFTYSPAGTLTAVEVPDPSANSTARVQYLYTYDTLKRPLTIRRPDSTTASSKSGVNIVYNGLTKTTTEVVGVAGGLPASTTTISDRFDRLSQVQEQTGASTWATTTYTYDPDDNVASIVDPEGVTTLLAHDFDGRRTRITRGARVWKYTYTKNGNMSSEQVPGSTGIADDINYTTTTAYDDLDRPIQNRNGQRALSTADQAAFGNEREDFTYDVGGNMLGKLRYYRAYAPGSSTASVDVDSRFTTQGQQYSTTHTLNIAGYPQRSRSFAQSFYLFGGVRNTTYNDQVGAGSQNTKSTISYDARALPSSIQLDTGATSNPAVGVQTRNVAGLVTKRRSTLVGGGSTWVESNWVYDKLGRVANQIVQKGPTISPVAGQSLVYFGNDDPKQVTHGLAGDNKVINYAYDRRHQLLTAAATTAGYFSGTYNYGNAGRLASANESQTISPLPSGTEVKPRNVNYVYGASDPEQVTALTNVTGGATYASFSYDAAGNMTAKCANGALASCTGAGKERFDFVYDGKDQLRRVTRRLANAVTGSEEYWYDGNGARVAIVKKNLSGAKTEMVWFTGDTQAHYDAVGTVTHVYSHLSLGTPVARIDRTADINTSVEYQFHGLASSTLATVASNGTINASFRYSPWGAVVESTNAGGVGNGTSRHQRRYNDKFVDDLSGLAYYGVRYYDKTLLGWTQADPLFRFAPDAAWAQPRLASLYAFSSNNAIRFVDPDGRVGEEGILPALGAGAAVAEGGLAGTLVTLTKVGAVGIAVGLVILASKIQEGGTPVNQEAVSGHDNEAYREHWAEQRENNQQWAEHDNAPNRIRDGTDYRRVDDTSTKVQGTAKDDPAPPKKVGNLPKPPTGKGSVPPGDRDPKRGWSDKQKEAKRKGQDHKCLTGCGTKLTKDNARAHHIKRHADGGRTDDANHAQVCDKCHGKLHASDKK